MIQTLFVVKSLMLFQISSPLLKNSITLFPIARYLSEEDQKQKLCNTYLEPGSLSLPVQALSYHKVYVGPRVSRDRKLFLGFLRILSIAQQEHKTSFGWRLFLETKTMKYLAQFKFEHTLHTLHNSHNFHNFLLCNMHVQLLHNSEGNISIYIGHIT